MINQWAFEQRTRCKRGHPLTAANTRPYADGRRECRECVRYRNRQHYVGHQVRKDVCPHGHKYTAETIIYKNGKRRCRLCRQYNNRKTYANQNSYRNRSTRSVCYVHGCRDHAADGLACPAHRAMLWVLDEEYRAYWRSIGLHRESTQWAA